MREFSSNAFFSTFECKRVEIKIFFHKIRKAYRQPSADLPVFFPVDLLLPLVNHTSFRCVNKAALSIVAQSFQKYNNFEKPDEKSLIEIRRVLPPAAARLARTAHLPDRP